MLKSGALARLPGICTSTTVPSNVCLRQAGVPRAVTLRRSRIAPYLTLIQETLTKFPTLTASRLYAMVRERGYVGGPYHLRHLIANHWEACSGGVSAAGDTTWRAEPMRLGSFRTSKHWLGTASVDGFRDGVSWSRRIFLHFFLDARMENFLRGHVAAFEAWAGLSPVVLSEIFH